jgi:hypothetical protein
LPAIGYADRRQSEHLPQCCIARYLRFTGMERSLGQPAFGAADSRMIE